MIYFTLLTLLNEWRYVLQDRRDTKWGLIRITNIQLVITLTNFPLVCTNIVLPRFLKKMFMWMYIYDQASVLPSRKKVDTCDVSTCLFDNFNRDFSRVVNQTVHGRSCTCVPSFDNFVCDVNHVQIFTDYAVLRRIHKHISDKKMEDCPAHPDGKSSFAWRCWWWQRRQNVLQKDATLPLVDYIKNQYYAKWYHVSSVDYILKISVETVFLIL